MAKFFCEECQKEFETDKPIKKEYKDYILGPCSKVISFCPECGQESNEKLTPKPQKLRAAPPQNSCDGNCRRCG